MEEYGEEQNSTAKLAVDATASDWHMDVRGLDARGRRLGVYSEEVCYLRVSCCIHIFQSHTHFGVRRLEQKMEEGVVVVGISEKRTFDESIVFTETVQENFKGKPGPADFLLRRLIEQARSRNEKDCES